MDGILRDIENEQRTNDKSQPKKVSWKEVTNEDIITPKTQITTTSVST